MTGVAMVPAADERSGCVYTQTGLKQSLAMSLFDKLMHDLDHDPKVAKDIALGKRVRLYKIRGQLGVGNFSKVKLGVHILTKEKVAIKIIDKTKLDDRARKILSREISCMEKLDHPNVIRLYEVMDSLQKVHLVMECAADGELADRIINCGAFREADAKPVFAQVVAAIQHMHEQGVIHRDLKAENVFFSANNMVKVGDFGFSTLSAHDQLLDTFCGSPPYAAPELFRDEQYRGTLVDVWAMGVLLYFTLSGKLPFRGSTVQDLKEHILTGSFYMPTNLSEAATTLIQGMLTHNPSKRYGILDIINSPWLQDFPIVVQKDSGVGCSKATLESEVSPEMKDILKEVMERLSHLTVPTDNLDILTDLHEPAGGVYRIVKHQVMKAHGLERTDDAQTSTNSASVSTAQGQNHSTRVIKEVPEAPTGDPCERPRSRFCILL